MATHDSSLLLETPETAKKHWTTAEQHRDDVFEDKPTIDDLYMYVRCNNQQLAASDGVALTNVGLRFMACFVLVSE